MRLGPGVVCWWNRLFQGNRAAADSFAESWNGMVWMVATRRVRRKMRRILFDDYRPWTAGQLAWLKWVRGMSFWRWDCTERNLQNSE